MPVSAEVLMSIFISLKSKPTALSILATGLSRLLSKWRRIVGNSRLMAGWSMTLLLNWSMTESESTEN